VSDIGSRIRSLRQQKNLSREAFAGLTGVAMHSVQKIEEGRQRVHHEALASIARSLDVSADWLLTGNDPAPSTALVHATDPAFVPIPRYTVSVSAGAGALVEAEAEDGRLAFSARWLAARGLRPAALFVLPVTGDSAEPRIRDGDLVLVDGDATAPRDGRLSIVRAGDEVLLKVVHRIAPDRVRLSSFNAFYPPRDVPLDPGVQDFAVLGQVVQSMSTW
jgi:phage repressor protein C with HTH and peptisase S24 domain